MENQDHEKRLHLAERLNWDYDVDPALLLAVIDGKMDKAGPFDADRLMVRSLERLSWYAVVALWGMDRLTIFPISTVLPRLRSVELRRRYDYAFRLLRNETLPTAGWSTEMRSQDDLHRITLEMLAGVENSLGPPESSLDSLTGDAL